MLKISQKLEYAIRAMIELAVRRPSGELVPAREIAAAQQIPLRFLEHQLGALGRAGLVESFWGAGGGCRLARDPAEITVAEVLRALDGDTQIAPCNEGMTLCHRFEGCDIRDPLASLNRAVMQVFDQMSIAQL